MIREPPALVFNCVKSMLVGLLTASKKMAQTGCDVISALDIAQLKMAAAANQNNKFFQQTIKHTNCPKPR